MDRVAFRTDPIPFEGYRGYLCRSSAEYPYPGPMSLVHIAGLAGTAALEREDTVHQMAVALRLTDNEWRSMCYLRTLEPGSFHRRTFFGQTIAADRLNYGWPRVCPHCLQEKLVWLGTWDLGLVSACPIHNCLLVNRCHRCGAKLTWHRPGVHLCKCGFDFRSSQIVAADDELLAMGAVIYRAAGFRVEATRHSVGTVYLPSALAGLSLDQLLGLALAIGSIRGHTIDKQSSFSATDLREACNVGRGATQALRDWPRGFCDLMQQLLPREVPDPGALTLQQVYGPLFQYFLRTRDDPALRFFRDGFESFVGRHWPGLIRGQHRAFSPQIRGQFRWISAQQAAQHIGLMVSQVRDLVQRADLQGIFVKPTNSVTRSECWIDRDSLARWKAQRDADIALYTTESEACSWLGLSSRSLRVIASAGLIRSLDARRRGFGVGGAYYVRVDIERIVTAFNSSCKHVAMQETHQAITLRDGIRIYLSRKGLSSFIQAVENFEVWSIGRDGNKRGITSFRFRVEDIKRYSVARFPKSIPGDFMTYKDAAARLKTNTEVIGNLAKQKSLFSRTRIQGLKLVRTADVERFLSEYTDLKSIADHLNSRSTWVARYLSDHEVDILSVALPGKGVKLFARRSAVENIEIPRAVRSKNSCVFAASAGASQPS